MEDTRTPEEKADADKRVSAFKEEYQALVKKYEIDFTCYPTLIPTKEGFVTTCVMTLMDRKNLPVVEKSKGPLIQDK